MQSFPHSFASCTTRPTRFLAWGETSLNEGDDDRISLYTTTLHTRTTMIYQVGKNNTTACGSMWKQRDQQRENAVYKRLENAIICQRFTVSLPVVWSPLRNRFAAHLRCLGMGVYFGGSGSWKAWHHEGSSGSGGGRGKQAKPKPNRHDVTDVRRSLNDSVHIWNS